MGKGHVNKRWVGQEYNRQSHYFVILLRNKPQEILISVKGIKRFYYICTKIESFTNVRNINNQQLNMTLVNN